MEELCCLYSNLLLKLPCFSVIGQMGSTQSTEEKIVVEGVVIDVLPSSECLVEVELGDADLAMKHQLMAYLSGKMRKNYIKVNAGDRVKVEISTYNPKLGRIVYKIDRRQQQAAGGGNVTK